MPFPFAPSEIKELIPSAGGNFCEKFAKLFRLPYYFHLFVSYFVTESGEWTDDFKADWCASSCAGSSTGAGALAAPVVSASDGAFSDKIQLTWSAVTGASTYDIYRHSVDDVTGATRIGLDITGTSYDDSSVTVSQYYYYWMKAKNGGQTSAFSASDRGHAGTISTTLPMIADLVAAKGFFSGVGGGSLISLVWTAAAGATSYDIHRNTIDDFNTSTLHAAGVTPVTNNDGAISPGPAVNHDGEITYTAGVGSADVKTVFYYWVIAKRSGPPAESLPSNNGTGASGWAVGFGPYATITSSSVSGSIESGVAAMSIGGWTKLWFALHGPGSGGAGGDSTFGAGSGGTGPVLCGWLAVSGTGKLRVVSTPEADTGNAASTTNGATGPSTALEYSAIGDFSDTVVLATANAGSEGLYNAGGAGAGGAAGTGSFDASVQSPTTFAGRAGRPGSGVKGGGSGQRWGYIRLPGAHFNGFGAGTTYAGQGNAGGSGSYGGHASNSTGGKGIRGKAFFLLQNA